MPEMPTAPTFQLNGSSLPWTPEISLATVLAKQGFLPERVATAINGAFVQREARESTWVQPGDQVMTFEAIVGG
ncbi:sulfur carrier protein ThiS [Hydrogenophaga sp. 5NK40-0174]|uniref:sulfur carrier protein ThiS n=1 Tax=Hydrogenophaga sp. 5NK40-0174 TaxID=3127649 RepID=UPI0031095EE9